MTKKSQPFEFISTNPATGKEIARYEAHGPGEVEAIVETAARTQKSWRLRPARDRALLLEEIARQLDLQSHDLAALMSREVGKTYREALAEVKKCAWTARYFAEYGPSMLVPEQKPTDARSSYINRQPLGVILGVMPWNFPLWQVFRFALPTLLAGNVVLVKHAPATMGCALAIEELVRQAGASRGLLQNLRVDVDVVAELIADPRVQGVSLTGSTRAGKAVAALAGAAMKPCLFELGGSDPFIVMPSASLERVLQTAVIARVQNNGQSCIAAKRFIVHEDVADAFTEAFVQAMSELHMGDPMDESIDLGPLISASARDQLHAQVVGSVDAGARLLLGGEIPDRAGFFYPPTVLTDIPPEAPVYGEEVFGPVASIYRVSSFEEALTLANDSRYGLAASVWTADENEAAESIRQLEVGSVFINGMSKSDPRLPFGGVRESGYGRELGRMGLFAFTNVKSVWMA